MLILHQKDPLSFYLEVDVVLNSGKDWKYRKKVTNTNFQFAGK